MSHCTVCVAEHPESEFSQIGTSTSTEVLFLRSNASVTAVFFAF